MQTETKVNNRTQQLRQWLTCVLPTADFQIESLAGDASFRCYHRVYFESSTEESIIYIVMDAPPEQESIVEFVQVAELMAKTVNVPDIIAKNIDEGFLALQDFGTTEFAHLLVDADIETVDSYYQQAMQTLTDLQTIANDSVGLPHYDAQLLMNEMSLFTDWFIPYLHIDTDSQFTQLWQNLTSVIITEVQNQPQVLVHRDYHSRNLMLDRNDADNLGVIDFQDAVIGAYSYDIVSLLRDAYVSWDEQQVTNWLHDFWQMLPEDLSLDNTFDDFYQQFIVMGVQRHLKVLGIFVRLSERDGKKRYLADIPKVMNDLIIELTWLKNHAQGDIGLVAGKFLLWIKNNIPESYAGKFVSN